MSQYSKIELLKVYKLRITLKHIAKNFIFLVSFLGIYLAPLTSSNIYQASVLAQEPIPAPPSNSATISPPSIEITADPGEEKDQVLRVSNPTQNKISYTITLERFVVQGQEGSVVLDETGQVDNSDQTITNWITAQPSKFDLEPGGKMEVIYTLKIPENAPPGGHFASVTVNPSIVASQQESGSPVTVQPGAQTLQKIAHLVVLRVSGDIKESGRVSNFVARNFIGDWEERQYSENKIVNIPVRDDRDASTERSYYSSGPIIFDILVRNEGNVHWRPSGKVVIRDIFGREVANLNTNPLNVFPGGERRIPVLWPEKNLWGIRYQVDFIATYGDSNQSMTSTIYFWGFPFMALVSGLATLIIIVVLRKRLIFAFNVLVRGGDVTQTTGYVRRSTGSANSRVSADPTYRTFQSPNVSNGGFPKASNHSIRINSSDTKPSSFKDRIIK